MPLTYRPICLIEQGWEIARFLNSVSGTPLNTEEDMCSKPVMERMMVAIDFRIITLLVST